MAKANQQRVLSEKHFEDTSSVSHHPNEHSSQEIALRPTPPASNLLSIPADTERGSASSSTLQHVITFLQYLCRDWEA